MPPFKPPGLQIVVEPEQPCDGAGSLPCQQQQDARGVRDSWEVKPDGNVAMLGRSLKGDYVFEQQGGSLIRAAGNDAPHYKVCEADLMMIKQLGAGACATVHKGYHKSLRRFVAVKRVSAANKEQRQQMLRDIKILSEAQEVPGLLAFLGAYLVPQKEQMAVVLEYMDGGTLGDVLAKVGRLPEDVMAQITAKLLHGLAFLHAKRMVHRDIKPANILMSLGGDAKLSDFGISATVDHTHAQCFTYAGTVTYMSPERLESKPYNFSADIWSLGLVLLQCLTGRYPYDARGGPVSLIIHVLQDEPPLPPPGSVSELCRDFLAACLARDPGRRPPASVLLRHPWLAGGAAAGAAGAGGGAGGTSLKALLRSTMLRHDDKLDEVAFHFAFTYYALLSDAASSGGSLGPLAPLYLDHSLLSHQGVLAAGRPAILAQLQAAVAARCGGGSGAAWRVSSVDSQDLLETGCLLVNVTGVVDAVSSSTRSSQQAAAAAQGPPVCTVPFAEAFILAQTPGGEYYVANQTFRLLA